MNIRQFFLLLVILSLPLCFYSLHANDNLFYDTNSLFNGIDSNWLSNLHFPVRSQATPQDILPLLLDIGILDLLQANIYKRTHPTNLRTRNLLDYPVYIPTLYSNASWTTGAYLFYNHTDRGFFTRTSDALSSYLGICDPKLLEFLSNEVLQAIIQAQFPNFSLDPLDVLPLFKNTTIQMRRTGGMFFGMKKLDNNQRFRFMIPVYYLESNFWLTEEEQREIERRFDLAENQDTFTEDHLITDKVGFGDLRLMYDMPLIDRSFFHLRGGIFTTIPISFHVWRSIKGSHLHKIEQKEPFDLVDLFCKAQGTPEEQEQAAVQGLCFFLGAIDQLGANIIELPMGNGRHLGIGGYIRYKTYARTLINRQWAHDIIFKSYLSLEFLMPKTHRRCFIEKSDVPEFNALGLNKNLDTIKDMIADDAAYASKVLSFLENQLTQKFYPFGLNTLVWPGVIFHSTTKIQHKGIRWGIEAGFDTWVQGKEQLSHINIPKNIPQDLNINAGRLPFAYQWKLFTSLTYTHQKNSKNWLFGIAGDYSFASTGIGSDYSIAITIERHF